MGLFNWFSWQLERRAMLKEMDRLRADLSETERQLYYAKRDKVTLRGDLGEAEQLLHEAQSGAKQVAEEYDKLKTQLELAQSAAGYWEAQAKQKQHQASTVPSVIETTEPAESELERKAWELWLRGDDSIEGVWRKAELWLRARESKRNGQERLTDEQ